MKYGRTSLFFFRKFMMDLDRRRMATFTIDDHFRKKIDIPYINDGNSLHKLDVYYADDYMKRGICVIYIHGGSFIFGSRKNATYYKDVFLNAGFDFVAVDYIHNDGHQGVENQIQDCINAINYLGDHKKELGLADDVFFVTGDSAGGLLSLYVTLLQDDKSLRRDTGILLNDKIHLEGALLNCPVYNLMKLAEREMLKDSGKERMFGANFKYENYRKLYSPAYHIDALKTPLFVSTCRNDFLREQSLQIKEDMERLKFPYFQFLDIFVLDKKVAHVHNVNLPDLDESKQVNNAMVEFIKMTYKRVYGK